MAWRTRASAMAAPLTELAIPSRRARLPTALIAGAAIVLVLLTAAVLAHVIAPYPFDQMHIRDRFSPPTLR